MTTAPALKPRVRSGLLQPPAEVDVVAGDPEALVEAADLLEHVLAEGHVAAGDVLGLAVGDEHVDRAAGRGGDAFGDEAVVLGRDVGPADAGVAVGAQQGGDVVEPVGVGIGVVVEEGDDLAPRAASIPVLRACAEAAVLGLDQVGAVGAGDRRAGRRWSRR